jgi:threonine/homoserine/homoserine lactone efflux protein
MANASKSMIVGSMAAAGLVALACLFDLIFAVPFAGQMLFDILFLLAAGVVLYMGWDAYRDLK